ncbi:MAG: hypothetical protein ACI83W_000328 [Marinoscillum sp.]|jgi:hypothetical protein
MSSAVDDVTKDSILYFQKKVRFDWHTEGVNWYIKDEILRADQYDSIMLAIHNIIVVRPKNVGLYDRTTGCYNSAISRHMDSAYSKDFYVEILNIVAQLNGEPPVIPDWKKEKFVNDGE